jgi:anti-sigma B factor antagonist
VTDFLADIGSAHGQALLRLTGELDIATEGDAFAAARRALERNEPEIVLDLAEVSFCDSVGLRFVARLCAEAEARGRTVVVRGMQPNVRRTFELAGMLFLLEPVPVVD